MMTSHQQLAINFAHGATTGKGSRMFIEDNTIYSYGRHFPIAKRCEGYYLFNTATYSTSTSKHQSYVASALWNKLTIPMKDCDPTKAQETITQQENETRDPIIKLTRARTNQDRIKEQIKNKLENIHLINKHILQNNKPQETMTQFIKTKMTDKPEIINKLLLDAI